MKRSARYLALPYIAFAAVFIIAPLILIVFYSVSTQIKLDEGARLTICAGAEVTVGGAKYTLKSDTSAVLTGLLKAELPKGTVLSSSGREKTLEKGEAAAVADGTRIVYGDYGKSALTSRKNNNFSTQITVRNFLTLFDFKNSTFLPVLWRSLYLAVISTLICLVLGYPMAYILSRLRPGIRNVLSFLFVLPMWMNFLLRTYAWMTLLENTGVINSALSALGLPEMRIMYTQSAVVLGMVYNFLPFMILPIYNMLIKLDKSTLEASHDLGAGRAQTFMRVILPLTIPGVMSGITMTFLPAVTTFVISKLLGGGQNALVGDLIERQFKTAGDWSLGSAMSVVLMVLLLLTMGFLTKYEREMNEGGQIL